MKQEIERKDIHWFRDSNGEIFRQQRTPSDMSPETLAMFKELHELSKDDPSGLLFPPGSISPPEVIHAKMIEMAKSTNAHPAILHAMDKTERMLSEETAKLIPDVEVAEWEEAVNEYVAAHPEHDRPPTYYLDHKAMSKAIGW